MLILTCMCPCNNVRLTPPCLAWQTRPYRFCPFSMPPTPHADPVCVLHVIVLMWPLLLASWKSDRLHQWMQMTVINPAMIWRLCLLKHQSGLLNEFDNWLSAGYVSLFLVTPPSPSLGFSFYLAFSVLHCRDGQLNGTTYFTWNMNKKLRSIQNDKNSPLFLRCGIKKNNSGKKGLLSIV